MKFAPTPSHPGQPSSLRWLTSIAAALLAVAIGCASPAPPQAPSLNLPEPAKDLAATRISDEVHLQWTTPEKTTSHTNINGPITAQICRTAATPPDPSTSCTAVARIAVKPGPSQATDTLPASLTSAPPTLLTYRVELLNSKNRSAGPSNEAFAPAGSAPPPIQQLRATPTRDGIQLEWTPTTSPASIELIRQSLNPDGTPILPTPKAPKPSANPMAKKPAQKPAPNPSPSAAIATSSTPTEIKLRTPTSSTDPGGTLDQTAEKNSTYRYTAQRVLNATLAGHALQLHSSISQPISLTLRDIFPPRVPTGLEAVPGGLTPADRSIDLSWNPNSETDLAGYYVYRQDIDTSGAVAATATRLNSSPVVGPAYRDQTAIPGRRYAYRVSAIDQAGNESPRSEAVEETLREQE
jgi:hypothetical protein